MNITARSHKEELQRKILKKQPEIIYRRIIQKVFESLNYVDTEVIENAVVLLPEQNYEFLEDFNMKDKIINLWKERVGNVFYHTSEQMYDWFKDSLKSPFVQETYQIAFGHTSDEKPVLLIHVAFDQIAIYYHHKDDIRRVFEFWGVGDFMKEREGEYPKVFMRMMEVIQRFKNLDILLNINGFSIEPYNKNNSTEKFIEEEYIDDFDRMIMNEFSKSKQYRDNIEKSKKTSLFAELQDDFTMSNFNQEQSYIFYLYCKKFFFEFFPYKDIIMNCFIKNPIHLCRAGYMISNPDIQLCITDDWHILSIWLNENGKLKHLFGIKKDMSMFSNCLKDNLVDEFNYLKKMKRLDEANEKYLILSNFMRRFTQPLYIQDLL